MKWFTSDTHWGHEKVIQYSNRPFANAEEMNEKLADEWNSVVSPLDEIWHLGDLSFMNLDKTADILCKLNGRKFLLFGNHDSQARKNKRFLEDFFEGWFDYKEITHDFGGERPTKIVLCHYPLLEWRECHYGSVMLHGHCHGNARYTGDFRIMDIGVDCTNYRPISVDQVWEKLKDKPLLEHH